MARVIRDEAVEPLVRVLLGAMNVDGGATDEQRALLDALASGLWSDHALDASTLEPLEPDRAAETLPDAEDRQRTLELLVLFELCRHPLSAAQVTRTEAYAEALDVSGHGMTFVRDLVTDGVDAAAAGSLRGTHVTSSRSRPPWLVPGRPRRWPTRSAGASGAPETSPRPTISPWSSSRSPMSASASASLPSRPERRETFSETVPVPTAHVDTGTERHDGQTVATSRSFGST
jgi:hypothetical protein